MTTPILGTPSLSDRMARMSGTELLGVLHAMGLHYAEARRHAGPVAPAKGARGLKRRAQARRHRASVARRHVVACRKATCAINTHGIYIAPRTTPRDTVAELIRRFS